MGVLTVSYLYRKTYDESIVLNSTPAAYWPRQEEAGGILVPTMKYNRINEKKQKPNKNGIIRNTTRSTNSSIL